MLSFIKPSYPVDEAERQAAVDRYGVAARQSRAADALVAEAAQLFDAKFGIATVIDREKMIVNARYRSDIQEIDRAISFCGHAILNPHNVMVIFNASIDRRFAGNPLVRGSPHIAFYVGAPLVAPCGAVLGALCAIDSLPRAQLLPGARAELQRLAGRVTEKLLG
ncbi:GAF domain-containing protein [Sphingomonas sp. HF-S4]|uniref:GAF domain-containing protein n=1 Tax=Sphingomonas agrestis TaxID=3080540 RepID=A0ABU3Y9L0_9SPHN|nr:GAF domain-containing protein [Sphingomonas sp. HF-S4]MDV3458081.1 GAF domain-containing protein [Sphingomonas sp. HF-S4]